MDAVEETAEFMRMLGMFFVKAHSLKIKHAYAELLVNLLEPLAATASAEVNVPAWTQSVESIYPKATKMMIKPRHTAVAYPLVTILMCVSKQDFFHSHWYPFVESCYPKFKVLLIC